MEDWVFFGVCMCCYTSGVAMTYLSHWLLGKFRSPEGISYREWKEIDRRIAKSYFGDK